MKILFIHKQILFPRDTGGKIRVLNLLPELAKRHEVTYLCNLRPGEEAYLPEMEKLGLRVIAIPETQSRRGSPSFYLDLAKNFYLSRLPFTISRNHSPALAERCRSLVNTEAWDLLICDTVVMASHTIDSGMPTQLLFQHNVESQILRRHAEAPGGTLHRVYMTNQWKRMRRYESEMGNHFRKVIAVSELDRDFFVKEYGWKHVEYIDTAVDLTYFRPIPSSEVIPDRVLFVGSMDWLPNQQGVEFFVREAWPMIRSLRPEATFWVVGRNPPPRIQQLNGVDGVHVSGGVPDIRPHLASAAVVVVPLLVGGGTRIKIFEAMAMAKAVVSTDIGAEGLNVVPEQHILLANRPVDLAGAVVRLLENPRERQGVGERALELVTQHYGTERVTRQFEAICEQTVSEGAAGAPRFRASA